MSPGATMMRVYDALKARITAGGFGPGERLDPHQLAMDLAASPTPVREALHRLAGERLVESWQQEGFRQPHIVEPAIRDLYDWSSELVHVVLRSAARPTTIAVAATSAVAADYVARVEGAFTDLALRSSNHEHRLAIASLNDRMALCRRAEALVLPRSDEDVSPIDSALADARWTDAARAFDHFHRRRLRIVGEIAGTLRSHKHIGP